MEWTRGPTIGRGSSAVVSLAATATGELFAVKSADLSSSSSNSLQNEKNLISQLCSPYVIKCLGSDITLEHNKSVYNLFLEYIPGGTLSDQIKKQGNSLDEESIRFYAHQMLNGLNYLHLKGIVHCDIKGQNVLVGEEGIKIVDFGCAKWMRHSNPAGFAGTPSYMAPEVARGEEQSFPADVWALGCTVIEMATGSNPWPEMKEPAAALYRVGYSEDVPEIPSWFSETGKDFLRRCLVRDSNERWTAAELLRHPFLECDDVNCRKIEEFTGKSPTSVVDQGFWDALEDSSPTPTDVSDSPTGRIRDLIGESFSFDLKFPDWTEEEDWMTVRHNGAEEVLKFDWCFEDMIEDCDSFSNFDEEEIQASVSIEDSIFNSLSDEIRIVDVSSLQVMLSESGEDDDYVSRIVTWQKMEMEFFSRFKSTLPTIFQCLSFLCFSSPAVTFSSEKGYKLKILEWD